MRNIDIVESRLLDRVLYNGFDREWVQKLGSDEATACFGSEKYTEPDDPTSQGERVPHPRTGMRQPLSVTQEPHSFLWASLFFLLPPLL